MLVTDLISLSFSIHLLSPVDFIKCISVRDHNSLSPLRSDVNLSDLVLCPV